MVVEELEKDEPQQQQQQHDDQQVQGHSPGVLGYRCDWVKETFVSLYYPLCVDAVAGFGLVRFSNGFGGVLMTVSLANCDTAIMLGFALQRSLPALDMTSLPMCAGHVAAGGDRDEAA